MSEQTTTVSKLTPGTWNVDPDHSSVGFTVRHLGMSKVRGQFNTFTGTVVIDENPFASTVHADVEMSSIDTNNDMRDGHLKSGDFFGVDENPHMTFRSRVIADDTLGGQLSINGFTKDVVFDLEFYGVTVDGYDVTRAGFSATGEISRSDFGIDFNMPVGLDGMLVSDTVHIELEVQIIPG